PLYIVVLLDWNQCLISRQSRIMSSEIGRKLIDGEVYEQGYPQRLGRQFLGVNLLDSSYRKRCGQACFRFVNTFSVRREDYLLYGIAYDFFRGFFLGFEREDLGTETTALKAAVNCSKGVFDGVLTGILPLSCQGVYNDSFDNPTLV